jgi:hypothetical protein
MSNPFLSLSRRLFIKGGLLGIITGLVPEKTFALPQLAIKLVGKPTATSFQVEVTSAVTAKFYLEYGYASNALVNKMPTYSINKSAKKSIMVSGLKSQSKIYYRLRYMVGSSKSWAVTSIQSLETAGISSNSVFAVQADPHMDENSSESVYLGTLKQIVAASPAFLMDLGDIFMVDKLQDKTESNIRGRFELMRNYYKALGSVPLKICLGNHDGELGYSKFNTKIYRKEYFPDQTSELAYYSFTGPDQLHIVLDPFTYTIKTPTRAGWEWTLGKTQYDWLAATLKNSKEQHKFIYIHHLLVGDQTSRGGVEVAKLNEWGGNNIDGTYGFDTNRPNWGKPVHQLLLDYKVGFVFKGHDHLYVKQELDGIIYQTLPQPSHPGEKLDVNQYGYISGKGVGGSGFLKVSTTNETAQVDFMTFEGKIADTYTRSVKS